MLTLLSTVMGAGELSAPLAVDSRDSSTCQNRAKHTTRREVEGPPKLRVGRAGRFKCLMAHPFESWGGGRSIQSHSLELDAQLRETTHSAYTYNFALHPGDLPTAVAGPSQGLPVTMARVWPTMCTRSRDYKSYNGSCIDRASYNGSCIDMALEVGESMSRRHLLIHARCLRT